MSIIKTYNIRIVPTNSTYDDIFGFKKQFITKYGNHPLSNSNPHITLAQFDMDYQYHDKLINFFTQLAYNKTFNLSIEGFKVFPKLLFLDVPVTKEINLIHEQLKTIWVRDLHFKSSLLKISKTPHITISKTFDKATLEASFDFFSKMGYANTFEVNHLILTSREPSKTWDWEQKIILTS
ncbi:2'-5' RNA ligase family protein [Yeosuana aromativorans]|nr:2'-5' RNA ligase family protein [Yeosuana aromativorans]